MRDAPDLLTAIDAIVSADGNPSGLTGRIALCVRLPSRDVVWAARLDGIAAGGFRVAVPADADAILVLGAEEAELLLTGRALPSEPERAVVGGDRRLLTRFFDRYCAFSSWLDVRAGGASLKRGRR